MAPIQVWSSFSCWSNTHISNACSKISPRRRPQPNPTVEFLRVPSQSRRASDSVRPDSVGQDGASGPGEFDEEWSSGKLYVDSSRSDCCGDDLELRLGTRLWVWDLCGFITRLWVWDLWGFITRLWIWDLWVFVLLLCAGRCCVGLRGGMDVSLWSCADFMYSAVTSSVGMMEGDWTRVEEEHSEETVDWGDAPLDDWCFSWQWQYLGRLELLS